MRRAGAAADGGGRECVYEDRWLAEDATVIISQVLDSSGVWSPENSVYFSREEIVKNFSYTNLSNQPTRA
jgi:hypothetical protein